MERMLRKKYFERLFCTCCNPKPDDAIRRRMKRRERQQWKRDVAGR